MLLKSARVPFLYGFLDLTPHFLLMLQQVLLETLAPNCEIIPAKILLFKSQKVNARLVTMTLKTLYQT